MSKNKNLAGSLFQAKSTPLTQKETSFSKRIADYLASRGIYSERLNGGGRVETKSGYRAATREAGTPGRLAIFRGRAIFIETKTSGKKPTNEQLKKREELTAAGAIVIACDSYGQFIDTFDAIRAAISDMPRTTNLYD